LIKLFFGNVPPQKKNLNSLEMSIFNEIRKESNIQKLVKTQELLASSQCTICRASIQPFLPLATPFFSTKLRKFKLSNFH